MGGVRMVEAPSGTVTFLFTDLEESTRLWEEHPDAMRHTLARHDTLLATAVAGQDGTTVKTTGDGLLAAFSTADAALLAALDAQRALGAETWPETGTLNVRMGLHTGTAEWRGGDYFGPTLNRASRLMAAAHGGQIVCSQAVADLVAQDVAAGVELVDLGDHRLKDLSRPERVYQVWSPGLPRDFPPLRSLDAYPGNLPLQLTSFVGRDADLDTVTELLGRAGRDARRPGRSRQDAAGAAGGRGVCRRLPRRHVVRRPGPGQRSGAGRVDRFGVARSRRSPARQRRGRVSRVAAEQDDVARPGQLRASCGRDQRPRRAPRRVGARPPRCSSPAEKRSAWPAR